MKKLRFFLFFTLFVACICIITYAFLYPNLPKELPIHWSAQGLANGFIPKELFFSFPIGIIVICIYSLIYYRNLNHKKERDSSIGTVVVLSIFLATLIGMLIYYFYKF